VVSGGHSSNEGASNVESGVTIDLHSLDEVTLVEDGSAVWLGPGARWGNVYAILEQHNLTVPGARLSHVGVGGFLLGGGISWFENQVGFGCDAITELEIVTPALELVQVSATQHNDLFWALKGSLGAFGIVTRIKTGTIRGTKLYAGGISFTDGHLKDALTTMHTVASNADVDDFSQGYISYAYIRELQDFFYAAYIVNTQENEDASAILAWRSVPQIHSTLRHTNIKESAGEISQGNGIGMRRSKFTFTVQMDVEVLLEIHAAIRDHLSQTHFDTEGLLGVTYQPLTISMLEHASKDEKHNLFYEAFASVSETLVLVSVELWWASKDMDDDNEATMRTLEATLLKIVEKGSIAHPWLYPNYAAEWQKPFDEHRIGRRTLDRLRATRKQYDPDRVWERLVTGSFKI
jgi:hypothetical protein